MPKCLSVSLVVLMVFSSVGHVFAQATAEQDPAQTAAAGGSVQVGDVSIERAERMYSESGADRPSENPDVTETEGPFLEIREERNNPVDLESERFQFVINFDAGVVFRATCYHIEYFNPCAALPAILQDTLVAQKIVRETKQKMSELLKAKGILKRLEDTTRDKIRRGTRALQRPGVNRPLVGGVMFAAGGLLAASKNEWAIDEGYIGVAIATVGLGLMLRPLISKWRGGGVNASRNGLAARGRSVFAEPGVQVAWR